MKVLSRLLSIGLFIALVSCSGGSVPTVRDYTNGNPTHNVRPQSVVGRCPPNQPNCVGGGHGWGGGGGGIATTECLAALGCSMQSLQDATLPDTVDPSTITDASSACAAIGESFDSVHSICFILGTSGRAQFGFGFTYYTYGQCAESLTGMHPGYDYVTTPTGQYVLFCVAPGEFIQPATAWYNVEGTWLGATGAPISLDLYYAVPAGQLFDYTHATPQAVFTKMSVQFCPATQAGGWILTLCTASGGAVSVGMK